MQPAMSSYPNGFNGGVLVRGIPLLNTYAKNALWVDSTSGVTGKGEFRRPFTTLQAAIDVSDADDTILIKPAHSETITGIGGLTVNKVGLTIVGLGVPQRRPRFLMDGADTVTAAISAAGVTLRNLAFAAGHADIATCFNVQAKGFNLDGCSFFENIVAENFLNVVSSGTATDNVADGMRLTANKWVSLDAAALNFLAQTGHCDEMEVVGNIVVLAGGTNSALVKTTAGDLFRGVAIIGNFLQNAMTANELLVNNNGSTNSGVIAHNRVRHADVTTTHDLGIDGLGCGLFDNLSTSVDNLSGVVLPAADVNS